jgi:putative ABC transport system permease protein
MSMARIGEILRKLSFLLQRSRLDRELQEEMRDHLERKIEKNMAAGMPAEEARRSAQLQLGNFTREREESRSSWGFPLIESVFQDVRYALRGLRKSPSFTTVAVATLALGIGATTAIFSIANAVLLRPLDYKDSDRLVLVWSRTTRFPDFKMGFSFPDFEDLRAQARSFETLACYSFKRLILTGKGEPEAILAVAASPDFLRVFSVQPFVGSMFSSEDYETNRHVVLLSYGLWQRRFASDRDIVGKNIDFGGVPYTVAGVLPRDFKFRDANLIVPMVVDGDDKTERQRWMFFTIAKLKPGVALRIAQAEVDSFQAGLAQAYPQKESDTRREIKAMQEGSVSAPVRTQLATLVGAVSFLLLIGCANVSNLVLSRSVQRQREIALRAALGASQRRILRQLFVESLVLALTGGLAGLLLAVVGIRSFRMFAPAGFSRLEQIHVEPAVAWIALLVSCTAGILCGLLPALNTARTDLNLALRERSGTAVGTPGFSLRNLLVICEVSLALALLTGSALLVQSLSRMMRVETGFRTDHLLTAHIDMGEASYPKDEARELYTKRLLETLRAEPQFTGVAISNNSLMKQTMALMSFNPEEMGIHEKRFNIESKSVSPAYFETMGIPLLGGRSFDERDVKGSLQIAAISQSLGKRLFPGENPVGKTLKLGKKPDDVYQIVAVVADTLDIYLAQKAQLQIYFPVLQNPSPGLNVMVRSNADPLTLVRALQMRVWSIDKDQPLTDVDSLTSVISTSVAEPRFRAWLLGAFAVAGLVLTLTGIYGVISYSVSQRIQEIGIRMALGAQSGDVLGMVLKQGMGLALVGAIIGLLGSLGLMRLLSSQLFGIKPTDPVTFAMSAVLMIVVAACASYIPALRATRVDPMIALRNE